MAATKIRSRWVSGLLEFFRADNGNTVLGVTEDGITANVTGNTTGVHIGPVIGALNISKAATYALTPAEGKNLVFNIELTAGSKAVTLGLADGQVAIVSNVGSVNAFTLKNVAGDTGASLAANKTVVFVASQTTDASVAVAIN